jgi:hypothetical protein
MLNPRRTWDKHFVTFAKAVGDNKSLQNTMKGIKFVNKNFSTFQEGIPVSRH